MLTFIIDCFATILPKDSIHLNSDVIFAVNEEEKTFPISNKINTTTEFSSAPLSDYKFKPTQLIAPSLLFVAGITGVFTLDNIKNSVRDKFYGYKKGHTIKADDYIQYATAAGYVGLGFFQVSKPDQMGSSND